MDRKGFTLVELIATVFILSLVLGIASYGIIGTINNSKKKSEEIFVDKIAVAIDEYISLYGSTFVRISEDENSGYLITKCSNSSCSLENKKEVKVYELYNSNFGYEGFKISTLVNENLFSDNKLVNPVNKLNCLDDNKDPVIRLFKDEDYVYYYYVDLSGVNTSCEISSDNGVISTLPDELEKDIFGDDELEDE